MRLKVAAKAFGFGPSSRLSNGFRHLRTLVGFRGQIFGGWRSGEGSEEFRNVCKPKVLCSFGRLGFRPCLLAYLICRLESVLFFLSCSPRILSILWHLLWAPFTVNFSNAAHLNIICQEKSLPRVC